MVGMSFEVCVRQPTGDLAVLASHLILNVVGFLCTMVSVKQRMLEDHTVGVVDGANEHVVGDVVEVTTVLKPWAGSTDVVSGALALCL